MKNGWEVKNLAALSAINYGYTESASSEPVGPRFLRITDIQDDHVDWDSVPYCKIEQVDLPKYYLASGDIVFARTGATTGKSFLVADPPQAVFASYLIRLRLLDNKLLPEFVSWFFQTSGYWKSIKEGSSGSAQGGFNATKLGALSIPVPPLPEQRRIVGILDEAFDGIATAKANAEKNLQNARALFESHLQAVFTQRGEGWVEKPLAELCTLISGRHLGPDQQNTKSRGIGYLTGPADFGLLNPLISRWTEDPQAIAMQGDILVTVKGAGVGKINLLDADNVAISRQLMAVRVHNADCRFIYYFLRSKFEHLQSQGSGATVPGLSREDILDLQVCLPAFPEQRRMVGIFDALYEESQRLESLYQRKLAALDELKKSLLHQAFSGQLTTDD